MTRLKGAWSELLWAQMTLRSESLRLWLARGESPWLPRRHSSRRHGSRWPGCLGLEMLRLGGKCGCQRGQLCPTLPRHLYCARGCHLQSRIPLHASGPRHCILVLRSSGTAGKD